MCRQAYKDEARRMYRCVTLLSVEMGCHGGDTPRVAHEDDFICQLFRFYVEMENASVLVDDKF